MARRNSNDTAPSTDETTENTEATASAEATESKADETPIDLTDFDAAVQTAIAEGDKSTGEVPEAQVSKVNEAYRALDGLRAKNAARAALDKIMTDSIYAQDAPKARSAVQIKEGLSAGSSSASKGPKDPTAAFVGRLAQLQAAFSLLYSNAPEGVKEGWESQVEDKANEVQAEAADLKAKVAAHEGEDAFDDSEFSSDAKKALKLSAGKAAGGSGYTGGPRRNTLKHIEQVFAGLEVGSFLSVTEINKARSDEYGPNDAPTTGAISQRLFPKKGEAKLPEGIEAVADQTPRGARKVA